MWKTGSGDFAGRLYDLLIHRVLGACGGVGPAKAIGRPQKMALESPA
jgi:hypothetical protein